MIRLEDFHAMSRKAVGSIQDFLRRHPRSLMFLVSLCILFIVTSFVLYAVAQGALERSLRESREAAARLNPIILEAILFTPSIPSYLLLPMFPSSVSSGHALEILKIVAQVTALVSPVSTAAVAYLMAGRSRRLGRIAIVFWVCLLLNMQLTAIVSSMLAISSLPTASEATVNSSLLTRPLNAFLWSWFFLTCFLVAIARRERAERTETAAKSLPSAATSSDMEQ